MRDTYMFKHLMIHERPLFLVLKIKFWSWCSKNCRFWTLKNSRTLFTVTTDLKKSCLHCCHVNIPGG